MRLWSPALVLILGCAESGAVGPTAPPPPAPAEARAASASGSPSAGPKTGSSDGTSCEEARAQYIEEIDLHGGGSPDLTAGDFGNVLNHGSYLAPCEVPEASKIQICVAVRGGAPVGVTVSLDPPNPEAEICVAKQVRMLPFPSHPKMDIAVVHF